MHGLVRERVGVSVGFTQKSSPQPIPTELSDKQRRHHHKRGHNSNGSGRQNSPIVAMDALRDRHKPKFIRNPSAQQSELSRSCRFAADASFLVIGYDSGGIKIWDFSGRESNPKIQLFKDGHTDCVNDLFVSPNGNLIISVSKSIKLWNRSGELLQTFKTNGGSMSSIYASFVDPNTHQSSDANQINKIVTVDDAGLLYILQILNFQWISHFFCTNIL